MERKRRRKKNQYKPAVFLSFLIFLQKRTQLQQETMHNFNACYQVTYSLMPYTVNLQEAYYLFTLNPTVLNMAHYSAFVNTV